MGSSARRLLLLQAGDGDERLVEVAQLHIRIDQRKVGIRQNGFGRCKRLEVLDRLGGVTGRELGLCESDAPGDVPRIQFVGLCEVLSGLFDIVRCEMDLRDRTQE